ncbi:MAG: VOC family protein [Deltaproteobacteria bacterium]|nr:VOC family protein [Deltaproteobacteria bacterium]MBW2076445.1 VOC family protein [Deltaproteobacteria bacterium]
MRLHHVGLVCSSQERADRFYEGILGLVKIKTSELTEDVTEQIFHTSHRCLMIFYGNESSIRSRLRRELVRDKRGVPLRNGNRLLRIGWIFNPGTFPLAQGGDDDEL